MSQKNPMQEATKRIIEGSSTMCYPADQESTVFYNPVQVQNRDLSVLMITLAAERRAVRKAAKAAAKRKRGAVEDQTPPSEDDPSTLSSSQLVAQQSPELTILDALAASGLRSMRYWKEIPGVKHITINDLDLAAVERAHMNIEVNELKGVLLSPNDIEYDKPRPYGIVIQHGDAKHEMYLSQRPKDLPLNDDPVAARLKPRFDIIDLDPYGSAAPFLDAALQAVESGGMLCVTCTDMVALGGSRPETCYGRYASMPISRAGYLQELALRILLKSLATTAATYGRTIRPILSVGMDFYIRVFVEVFDDKAGVNALSLKIGNVYQSTLCSSFHVMRHAQMGGKNGNSYQPARAPKGMTCEETGAALKVAGPIWLGPLHNREVIREALIRLEGTSPPDLKWIATKDRLRGLLMNCLEELDAPLYYNVPDLSQTLSVHAPRLIEIKAALINAGYSVSGFHKEPQAIKTNAPNKIVWDIMRAWVKRYPPKNPHKEGSVAARIMSVEPSIEVDFTIPSTLKSVNKAKVARFPMNPQPNWGPKPKASGTKRKAEADKSEE